MRTFLVWRGLDAWRAEHAHVRIGDGRLEGSGGQIGSEPEPYELRYELATGDGFVTKRLSASARGAGWKRELELVRRDDGGWTANGEPRPELGGALDCDIQNCPLTNSMPVLRDRLLESAATPRDYAMAWIAVPELTVRRSEQRYEPIDEQHVRYVALDGDFTAELTLDEAELVVHYPDMAELVQAVSSGAS